MTLKKLAAYGKTPYLQVIDNRVRIGTWGVR